MQFPYDDELLKLHLARAAESLPGPDYYTVLRWIHKFIKPANYIEIGIRQGDSLRCAEPETLCIGIDPVPDIRDDLPATTRIFPMTSKTFFESQNLPAILGMSVFSLAFIDGLHLFEQVLQDFINLEKFSSPQSILMLHDCLPLDAVTASRTRTSHFYSGDIWKLALCLKRARPDLNIRTIRAWPTGLCLVTGLDRCSNVLSDGFDRFVDEYVPLTFEDYRRRSAEMPQTIESSYEAVTALMDEFRNTPPD
jgi:hypothetical protein